MNLHVTAGTDEYARLRQCAAEHGLRLHRIDLLATAQRGTLPSTMVFDCQCGERWLFRVRQGDVVAVDAGVLDELRRGRDGQRTAPPGSPAAEDYSLDVV